MEPIAIVGMACRLPGAQSLTEFWALLRDGRHGIDLVPSDRWDRESIFDPNSERPGKVNSRHGGFIKGIDLFDHGFFGISPEEARQMDPQQRIMLELTYEAFEDAGLSITDLEGADVGVFVGVMSNDYLRAQTAGNFLNIDKYTGAGSGYCMIANRISYQFNLRGPSMAIDSACSSSLVSAFMACESLWTNQCTVALAAGVNLILSPALSIFYNQGGLSAPDGKCRTFSGDASGMGRGEGAGIVVLKRLSDAHRDGDNIYAVIRGGSVNHNGRSNGMSAPNRWAQQQLLSKAYRHAGIAPGEVQYVELHGTGTLIGDAIEATALGSVLAEDRSSQNPCLVGSVKSNVGHLEGAAGMAGLIKLALCMKHGQLVPSLWFDSPNLHIPFDTLPLKVQDKLQPWPDHRRSRLGGVSSFGLGGANAHLVLEFEPSSGNSAALPDGMRSLVLQFSARSEAALNRMARNFRDFIGNINDSELSAFCRTSLVRPSAHDHRAACVADSREELLSQLSCLADSIPAPNIFTGRRRNHPRRRCAFVFPGFSAAGLAAAAPLVKSLPGFAMTLSQCDVAIHEVVRRPVDPIIAQLDGDSAASNQRTLPLTHFGLQIALAGVWRSAGLQPDSVAGLGLGQLAACCAAGAISINSAIARIAAATGLDLTGTGYACLDESSPFLINCISQEGQNIIPDASELIFSERSDAKPFPAIAKWFSEPDIDCILQTLDAGQIGPLIGDCKVVYASDLRSFWVEMAGLSIHHNIQWKNLVTLHEPVRGPRYPWQHTRHWLDTGDALAGAAQRSPLDEGQKPVLRTGVTSAAPEQQSPAVSRNEQTVSGLTRDSLFGLPERERRAALAGYLKQQLAQTLRRSEDEFEEPHSLVGLGLDSLTALQLKNRVEGDLQMPVSLVKLIDGHSINDLTAELLSSSSETDKSAAAVTEQLSGGDLASRIDSMSLEHIDQMLRELLTKNETVTGDAALFQGHEKWRRRSPD